MIPPLNEATIRASKSLLTPEFRKTFKKLSDKIVEISRLKYIRWRERAETLNFEPKFGNIYVVEITYDIHAVAEATGDIVKWLWIGKYNNYIEKLDFLRASRKKK